MTFVLTNQQKRKRKKEKKRDRAKERKRELLAWVFEGFLNIYIIFAWIFKRHLLKHMQITTCTCIKISKPMIFVSTNQQQREREKER